MAQPSRPKQTMVDYLEHRPKAFIIEFGSHRYDKEHARDIDVIVDGLSDVEVEKIVRDRYPEWKGPIDITGAAAMICNRDIPGPHIQGEHGSPIHPNEFYIAIPVPGDTDMTDYGFLYVDPPASPLPLVAIERKFKVLSSILRGWEQALKMLELQNAVEVTVSEAPSKFELDAIEHPYSSCGRLAVRKAALDHMGIDQFNKLCDNLWWGKFLRRFVNERPSESGVKKVAKKCYAPYNPKVFFMHEEWKGELSRDPSINDILISYSDHRVWTPDELEEVLYG